MQTHLNSFSQDTTRLDKRKYFTGFISGKQYYGFIPFQNYTKYPAASTELSGKINFDLFKLPFSLDFFHTTNKTLAPGLNHISLSFNTDEYKSRIQNKLNEKKEALQQKVDSLYKCKSSLEKQYYHNRFVIDSIKRIEKFSINKNILKDSLENKTDTLNSLRIPETRLDTLEIKNDFIDLKKLSMDSADLRNRMNSVETTIDDISAMIDQIENYSKGMIPSDKVLKSKLTPKDTIDINNRFPKDTLRKPGFFDNISKFEIGNANPDYSVWLIKNTIKGFNIQSEHKNYFSAFSYGTVIDYDYFNQSYNQNLLKSIGSDFADFYSFNSTSRGKKILCGEVGFGNLSTSYVAVGLLKGIAKETYLLSSDGNIDNLPNQINYVGEVHGKISYGKNNVGISFANSALKSSKTSSLNESENLFTSKSSKAVSVSTFNEISKTIKIQTEGKYVQPYFKSFGLGFNRADILRAKIKLDKQLRKLKLSLTGKYEENNLLNILSYKNRSYSFGASASYRLNRHLTIKYSYAPVFINTKQDAQTTLFKNVNHNLTTSWQQNIGELNLSSSFNYVTNYSIDRESIFRFNCYSIINVLSKDEFSVAVNGYYIRSNSVLLAEESYTTEMMAMIPVYKSVLKATAGLKACCIKIRWDVGYLGEISYQPLSCLVTTLSLEKFNSTGFNGVDIFQDNSNKTLYSIELRYIF